MAISVSALQPINSIVISQQEIISAISIKVGWNNGAEQADMIFTENLNRLKRDMLGMIMYRKLLALHMVSAPFVAKAQLGVTGDATQLRINDQVLRITAQSELQPNAKKWQPVITK